MPSRKNPDETFRDIVHPINAQFRAALESAVIDAYTAALEAAEDAVEDAEAAKEVTSV
jgi:stage V sporulation protein G